MNNRPHRTELPFSVSVRFSESDFRRLVALAQSERRTLSQTVRLLIEAGFDAESPVRRST